MGRSRRGRALGAELRGQPGVRTVVGAAPTAGHEPVRGGRADEPLSRGRHPRDPAGDPGSNACPASPRRPGCSDPSGSLPGRPDSRRPLRRAVRGRPPADRRRPGGAARRDRGVPGRQPRRSRGRSRAGDDPLHRHRRLDRGRGRARGRSLARSARTPRRHRSQRDRGPPGPRGQDDGRRLPRHVRRTGAGDPLRAGDPQGAEPQRAGDPGGYPQRRGRDRRRGHRRHGGEHRRSGRGHGGTG